MRNIVVGHDGKLWLVDWGWSGFYPPFCEYIATKSTADNDSAPKSWWKYIPLITGAWLKEEMIAAPAFANIRYVYTQFMLP
jgi:thiamine kinase-like enzyme